MRKATALIVAVAIVLTSAASAQASIFEPITPLQPQSVLQDTVQARVYDSRSNGVTVDGLGVGDGKLVKNVTRQIAVAGRGGIQPTSAAVVFNVTVTGATAGGDLRLWPCEAAKPTAITLAYGGADNVANTSIIAVQSGKLCAASTSTTHLILDVVDQFAAGSGFLASQKRLVNTSTGFNGSRLAAKAWKEFFLPAPSTENFLNITAFGSSAAGFVTVQRCDPGTTAAVPAISTVNFNAGERISNMTAIDNAQHLCAYSSVAVDLYIETLGSLPQRLYGPSAGSLGNPFRVFDTRSYPKVLGAGATEEVFIRGIPLSAGVVVVNLTVVRPSAPGYVTAYDCDDPGTTSTLNFRASNRAHLAMVRLSTRGSVCVRSSVATGLLVDLAGWYSVTGGLLSVGYNSTNACGGEVNPTAWSLRSTGSAEIADRQPLVISGGVAPYQIEVLEPSGWQSTASASLIDTDVHHNAEIRIVHPALAEGDHPMLVIVSDAAGTEVLTDLTIEVGALFVC